MGKTTVIYKDIAVGAAEAATVSATGQTAESQPQNLLSGVDTGKVITLERNRWILNGSFNVWYENGQYAFWSSAASDDEGLFQDQPVITISFSQQFTSPGINLTFDSSTGEYCSSINVKWYQGNTLKADKDFFPDSTEYFCEQSVESYNKIVITIKETSLPNRFAKINHIIFGVIRRFGMDELRNASITNEMDESAIELPVSTFNWTLESRKNVEYMFQLKQPVEAWNNNNLIGVYYISAASRQSKSTYSIECSDAIGALSEMNFPGGAYLSGISAKTLLNSIAAPFTVEYAPDVVDKTLKGVLLPQSKREAIQQVIFAWGVCLATDNSDKIRIFNQDDSAVVIPKGRTFSGVAVDTDAIVTKVSVTAHTYTQSSNGDVKIGDVSYADAKTVYTVNNPNVTAADRENEKEITDATLVSTDIGQDVADRVYAYYSKRDTSTARIVYDGEKLGDCISVYTPWDTLTTGNLHKMEIKLSNTVVYGAEVTG